MTSNTNRPSEEPQSLPFKVHVLYFAKARALAGVAREDIDLLPLASSSPSFSSKSSSSSTSPPTNAAKLCGCSLRDFVDVVARKHPELSVVLGRCAFSVNEVYCASLNDLLADGDTIAVMPPVSGG